MYLAEKLAEVDPSTLLNPQALSVVGILGFIVLAFLKRWIVTGVEFNAEREERLKWEQRAWASRQSADQAVSLTKDALNIVTKDKPP